MKGKFTVCSEREKFAVKSSLQFAVKGSLQFAVKDKSLQ
jgi:hypothetical protein